MGNFWGRKFCEVDHHQNISLIKFRGSLIRNHMLLFSGVYFECRFQVAINPCWTANFANPIFTAREYWIHQLMVFSFSECITLVPSSLAAKRQMIAITKTTVYSWAGKFVFYCKVFVQQHIITTTHYCETVNLGV